MKKYVLTLSKQFPTTHSRKYEDTCFLWKFNNGQQWAKSPKESPFYNHRGANCKLHTIRENYLLWKQRIELINAGTHELHIRQWSARPYNSPQEEVCVLGKGEIGYQHLTVQYDVKNDKLAGVIDQKPFLNFEELANNDGLLLDDWKQWFFGEDISKLKRKYKGDKTIIPTEQSTLKFDGVIIHFTPFRYK